MLTEICDYLHNDFAVSEHYGDYSIEGGTIDLPFMQDGQYFRIKGSVFNDGVHQYPDGDLMDETFKGCIIAQAIPSDLVKLASEVNEWRIKDDATGNYVSESFGGYSYSKVIGSSGIPQDWIGKFGSRLRRWRKL